MSDISDISKSLLAQYYGFSKKLKTNKILIHEYVSSVENSVNEFIGEKSIVHANSDVTSGETYMQENVENEDRNSEFDVPVRSSRTLEWEAFEDDETLSKFDIILEANVMDNSYKKAGAPSDNETHNLALYSDKISTILGPENNDGNDLHPSVSEDALPDSASDISSITETKKSKRSPNLFASLSTPPPNKNIYNETFIDLTNASLTSLPIEMVEKYPMIKMLYLENNNLRELPKELFVLLTHLQWLDIRNNQLTSLPTSIQSHSSLETILLQGNKIEKLPLELCLVPKLKILNVANNPIIVPPKDIIALGCSSILNYLRAEWNKLHPDKSITLMEQKIEPKPSTILCYQSLCEKRRKLIKSCKVQVPKDTNDISHSFKDASVGKKNKGHESSSKYSDMQINTFLENSVNSINDTCDNDETSSLCALCARNVAAVQWKNESNREKNGINNAEDDNWKKRHNAQHVFLKMITSCYGVKKNCSKKEIIEVDAKILHLTGPSPRSYYVRRNITGLITYEHYRKKECRIKAISNETKHIVLSKPENFTVFSEKKKKCRNTKHADLIFDIVTKDMRRMQLRPMQLKDLRCMLSCLENYFDIKID
ncbi:uncharacterized protein [Linepithema humile]|uniref:uncharacterized protein n=1 Tax=Linepithema humile TaxID=83485 RepID=UPI00351DAA94